MKTAPRVLASLSILAGIVTMLSGCGGMMGEKFNDYVPPTAPDMELLTLSQFMVGSFSSAAQAASDSDYRDIRLEIARIWPSREDGIWLYVEQTAAGADSPYRQRVYRLTRKDDTHFISDVYLLPDDPAYAGAWSDPARFDEIAPEDLNLREGCSVTLERTNDYTFTGATGDQTCPSEMQGASYSTSEVTLTPGWIKSWDRGFDDKGNQVWGAQKGPYMFQRIDQG